MMDKRLKEKLEAILTLPDLPWGEDLTAQDCKQIYDILCKIEQGTLIKRPPIKKGDYIWIVCRYRQGSSSIGSNYIRKVICRCVDKIFLNNDNSFTISTLLIEKGIKRRAIVKSNTFKRTWFLTPEEAEKRLKELQE
ncbi:MAG: hypothetical protein IJ308_04320 [Clostridia bacterium]|nr:hypothetical protein [Clostridia bacterium]